MKQDLIAAIEGAVSSVFSEAEISTPDLPEIKLDVPRNPEHGDYSCNIAMILAKQLKKPPRDIAAEMIAKIGQQDYLAGIDIAGPGFLNFKITNQASTGIIPLILERGPDFGRAEIGNGQRVQIEFVSANPTGPLHVGHGRGAAYGDALARLFENCGYVVDREYYVNDAGRQMDILALSVWVRWLQQHGIAAELPANAYQGDYVQEIARLADLDQYAQQLPELDEEILSGLMTAAREDEPEKSLDQAIQFCRSSLGPRYDELFKFAGVQVMEGIKADLQAFGIVFTRFASELEIARTSYKQTLGRLSDEGYVEVRDGAQWFKSTAFGDEKDRVAVRADGSPTYFASDIEYHRMKFEGAVKYDHLVNIWGADHHGYIARVRAALTAMGLDEKKLEILLVQFAALFRNGEKIAMSTRSGKFVALREMVDEVGQDAARFFYLTRRSDQHLDFDLDLAKSKNKDNPVYYIQYAHARICRVFDQLTEQGLSSATIDAETMAKNLTVEKERALMSLLTQYPELVQQATISREPHQITHYLRDMASTFHTYYDNKQNKILVEDRDLRASRLCLIEAVAQVIRNGLSLLGISAPRKM